MELTLNCKFCGAYNIESNQRCHSCNAPLEKLPKLSDEIKSGLFHYILNIEEVLKADKEKAIGRIVVAFVVFIFIDAIAITGFYYGFVKQHFLLFVLLSLFITFILLIIFGLLITKLEDNTVKRIFKKRIKNEILIYLEQNNISMVDFKRMVSAVLPRNAFLVKFLVEL